MGMKTRVDPDGQRACQDRPGVGKHDLYLGQAPDMFRQSGFECPGGDSAGHGMPQLCVYARSVRA